MSDNDRHAPLLPKPPLFLSISWTNWVPKPKKPTLVPLITQTLEDGMNTNGLSDFKMVLLDKQIKYYLQKLPPPATPPMCFTLARV